MHFEDFIDDILSRCRRTVLLVLAAHLSIPFISNGSFICEAPLAGNYNVPYKDQSVINYRLQFVFYVA